MAEAAKKPTLDLPVFNPGTGIVWGRSGLKTAQKRRDDTFVRRTRFRALHCTSLEDALIAADSAFDAVAHGAGGLVVNHTWGLYKSPGVEQYFRTKIHEELLPEDHILVAEVDVIRGISKLTRAQKSQIEASRDDYYRSSRGLNLTWGESGPYQFVNGYAPGRTEADLWLVDIEPLLSSSVQITNSF